MIFNKPVSPADPSARIRPGRRSAGQARLPQIDILAISNARFILCIIALTVAAAFSSGCSARREPEVRVQRPGALRVHPTNPRYFADRSGKAIYLGGHQMFTDLQDRVGADILGGERVGNESRVNWEWDLAFLASRNINYIRNWTEFSLGPSPAGSLPLPYERVTGFGNANDGQPKVDLHRFNQLFFDRMRSRAIDLGKRRVYISFMLFDVYGFSNFAGENDASLFNAANNINGVNADRNGDGWGVEFFMEPTAEIRRLQQDYAKKVVDTIGDLDNVFIEISNEAGNIGWHYDMIKFIRS